MFDKKDRMQSEHEEQEMEEEEKKTEEVFTLVSTFILTPHTHKPENTSQIYKHKPGAQPLVA